MTERELAEKLEAAVGDVVRRFLKEKSEADLAYDAELERLRVRIEGEPNPAIQAVLASGLAAFKEGRPKATEERRAATARAFQSVMDQLGLGTHAGRTKGGKRTPKAEVTKAAEVILAVLAGGQSMSKAEVLEAAELTEQVGGAAVARLKREGTIESNGKRGAAARYQSAQG